MINSAKRGEFKPRVMIAVFSLFFLTVGFAATFIGGGTAAAGREENSRLRYGDAGRYCNELPGEGFHGMLWLSNQDSYYSEQVIVGQNDETVNFSLRGAVNSCERNQAADAYAVDVRVQSGPLWLSRGEFWRGYVNAGNYQWSSEGERMPASLDIRGVASCEGRTGLVSQGVYVEIYRRLKLNNTVLGDGNESIVVNVQRQCPEVQWNLDGQSYVKNTGTSKSNPGGHTGQKSVTALPGDRLNWYHDIRNNGPNDMNRDINFQVNKSGFSNGWNATIDPSGNARGSAGGLFVYEYANDNRPYTLYDVTQDDVGNRLCQQISWDPTSWNTGGRAYATPACVNVLYQYNLIPSTSNIVDGTTTDSQGPIQIDGYINNEGPTKSRPNTEWQISQVVYRPGVAQPQKAGGTGPAACTFFTAEQRCSTVGSGSIGPGVLPGNSGPYVGNSEITDEPAGTKICFAMSVRQYNQTAEDWRHSALSCRIVSKSPKVQIRGGDVVVGKGTTSRIATSITQKGAATDERTFGSWGEYAVTASGPIYGMASAAGYAGEGAPDRAYCTVSYLTITNAGSNQCTDATPKGMYTFGAALPPVESRFVGANNLGNNPRIDVATQRGVVTGTGTIEVRGSGDVGAGQWLVINAPEANVLIRSDLKYTGAALASADQIPQVIIIANNISIEGGVGQVDAWLIASGASGTISTCSDVARFDQLNAETCANTLTVNGPVAARKLFLYRTAGSEAADLSGQPAELFNTRPDAYIWAANYAVMNNRIQTATSSELPPRF